MNARAIERSASVPSVVAGVTAHRVLDRWEAMGLPMESLPFMVEGEAPISRMQDLAEKLYGRRPPAELMVRLWEENALDVLVQPAAVTKGWGQRQCERWASRHRSLLWHMGSEWRQMEIQHAALSEATAWRRAVLMGVGAAIGFWFSAPGGWLLASLALWPAAWGLHHAAMRRGLAGLPAPTEREADKLFGIWSQAAEAVCEKELTI